MYTVGKLACRTKMVNHYYNLLVLNVDLCTIDFRNTYSPFI